MNLGELEQAVMKILWRKGQATVREVYETVGKKRTLAYTTVMTVMTRLCDKRLLCRSAKSDGSFLYKPCQSQEEFYAKNNQAVFSELIRKFGAVAVAQFVDTLEKVDPKQIAALKQHLWKRGA